MPNAGPQESEFFNRIDVKLPFAIATVALQSGRKLRSLGQTPPRAQRLILGHLRLAQVLDLPIPKFEIARIAVLVGFLSLNAPKCDGPE